MELDIIASIVLTVVAGLVVTTLSIGFGEDTAARVRIAIGLIAWFAVVALLGATKALHYPEGTGAPGLGIAIVIPIVVLVYGTLRIPSFRRRLYAMPMQTMVGLNGLRILGMFFLILYALGRLPSPFAQEAGWGDIVSGLIAIILAWRLRFNPGSTRASTFIWNTLGMLDLFGALALGVISSPGPLHVLHTHPSASIMTLLPWLLIPGFLVPIYLFIHVAIYTRLHRSEPA
jgi:hypothetical protein